MCQRVVEVGRAAVTCFVRRAAAAIALSVCLILNASADICRRVAVVVGNAAYPANPLPNPRNDARAVTGSLRELGFRVLIVEGRDASRLEGLW